MNLQWESIERRRDGYTVCSLKYESLNDWTLLNSWTNSLAKFCQAPSGYSCPSSSPLVVLLAAEIMTVRMEPEKKPRNKSVKVVELRRGIPERLNLNVQLELCARKKRSKRRQENRNNPFQTWIPTCRELSEAWMFNITLNHGHTKTWSCAMFNMAPTIGKLPVTNASGIAIMI